MTPKRWERVQEIFGAALALGPDARAAFLQREFIDDAELRREVESLLASHDSASTGFLEQPAIDVPLPALGRKPLSRGSRLGTFEIIGPLGAGGMGEVYKARDSRLGRDVAIKVLPLEVASDRERLKRFEKEARSASALNHPNIVTIYETGTSDGVPWIAMEHVEGETLQTQLANGPLATKKLLNVAVQIAEGLARAHEAGIVHRDLKPENVMLTKDGLVKILDFGLAKLQGPAPEGSNQESQLPTVSGTSPGIVLGTVGYMSPEQASGKSVDFRSDQFSFGSILYEMATGKRAFQKKTAVDTLAAILNEEPEPIARLRPGVPPPLRWVIERCHAKLEGDRYQSTRDLAREVSGIREHLSEVSQGIIPEPTAISRPRVLLVALGVAVVAAIFLWASRESRRSATVPEFARLTFRNGVVTRALFSQKSNSILYTASWDGEVPQTYLTLPESKGTDRSLEAGTQLPMAFSEDGSEVLVLLGRSRTAINSYGTLAWWPALGGKARPLLENAGWADWAKRLHFLAVVQDEGPARALQIRDSTGKVLRTLFRTAGAISWVAISPDEAKVAFFHHPSRFDDAAEVRVAAVDGSKERALTSMFERGAGLRWNGRAGEVWYTASQSDIYATSLWGVAEGRRAHRIQAFSDFFQLQDISSEGCLFVASAEDTRLVLRRGEGTPSDFSWLGSTFVTDISPDGRSILFLDGSPTAGTFGAWVRPLDGGEAIRVADGDPGRFSPDGQWIVATSRLTYGPPHLILVPASGGTDRSLPGSPPAVDSEPSFAGRDTLLFIRSQRGRRDVWRMKIDGTGAQALGVAGCRYPTGDPIGARFLCIGEPDSNTLILHTMSGRDSGRTLYALAPRGLFLYARWSTLGDRIWAVTGDQRLLTLDPSTGAVLHEERVPLRVGIAGESLVTAACSPDGTTQAYSISYSSSRLYLGRGM
jgi:serine/threonine protein kinase/Tol biopolymer transport system component